MAGGSVLELDGKQMMGQLVMHVKIVDPFGVWGWRLKVATLFLRAAAGILGCGISISTNNSDAT